MIFLNRFVWEAEGESIKAAQRENSAQRDNLDGTGWLDRIFVEDQIFDQEWNVQERYLRWYGVGKLSGFLPGDLKQ